MVAAKYLASVLEKAGVAPAGDGGTYLQRVPMASTEFTSVPSLSLVDAEDIPIAYLPGNALRVRVKVVGDIESRQRSTPDARDIRHQYA